MDGYDPTHDVKIEVQILDTVTGQVHKGLEGFGTWWWTDGNGSCDCNRQIGGGAYEALMECTTIRYKIVDVKPLLPGYTLADFNEDYPT